MKVDLKKFETKEEKIKHVEKLLEKAEGKDKEELQEILKELTDESIDDIVEVAKEEAEKIPIEEITPELPSLEEEVREAETEERQQVRYNIGNEINYGGFEDYYQSSYEINQRQDSVMPQSQETQELYKSREGREEARMYEARESEGRRSREEQEKGLYKTRHKEISR